MRTRKIAAFLGLAVLMSVGIATVAWGRQLLVRQTAKFRLEKHRAEVIEFERSAYPRGRLIKKRTEIELAQIDLDDQRLAIISLVSLPERWQGARVIVWVMMDP